MNITRPEGTVVTSGTYKGWYVVDNSDPENGDEYIMGHLVNGFMVYEMSCTENCSDVYQLLDNKSFSQLSRYFRKREKKLVNYMINPDDGTRSFEMD